MNDHENPIKDLPKPKRVRSPKIAVDPVYDDPYADDLAWNTNSEVVAVPAIATTADDPYAEPLIERTADPIIDSDPYYSAEPFESENNGETPLFQPDIVPNFVPAPFEPETTAETVRRSGLAYSIGIVFVVSVAFMLLLGWIADWMFGTKPWGLVGGIVLGSIIGFVQVIRISSRIFTPNKNGPAISPLMSHVDDKQDENL